MATKKKRARKKRTAPRQLLSPEQYGATRKPPVTRQAVMRAITSGRLTKSTSRTDRGWHRIDPELANKEWAAWTDRSKQEGARHKAGGRPAATAGLFGPDEQELHANRLTHSAASADRIMVDAELKRLDLEERRGTLIDRREAQTEAFQQGRDLRDAILRVPDRISSDLAAAAEPGQVHRLLTAELVAALETITMPTGPAR